MDVLNCQEIDSSGLLYVFIYSSIHHEDLLKSENVISADISRVSLLSNNLIAVNNLGPFIHNLILEMCILADNSMSKYNTVLNHGTWFDLAATSDNRILYSSLDQTSVGDNRILNICSLKILSRAGVVGSGIDRPFRIEQGICCLEVNQREMFAL